MRVSSSIKLLAALVGGTVALGGALSACYNPNPQPNSFTCDVDAGGLCPSGFTCNPSGFCVRPGTQGDMLMSTFDISSVGDMSTGPRTCDQRVQAGAFSNLVELKTLNTSGDESHLAFDGVNLRLLFQRGSSLFSSSVSSDFKSPAAPTAVTVTGGPTTINGGSFTTDGNFWFSGTTGSSTSLYQGVPSSKGSTTFAATSSAPTAACPFFDPVFVTHLAPDPADMAAQNDLFIAYPLNGCSGASYVARGAQNLNISAFYSAVDGSGFQSPTMTASGLTLMLSSTGSSGRIFTAARSDITYQFGSPISLDLTSIGGPGTKDVQMVVTDDCTVAYFVTVRTGGTGGQDIWAADIAAQ